MNLKPYIGIKIRHKRRFDEKGSAVFGDGGCCGYLQL